MKRIISLILAVLLLCPTFAMADATKDSPNVIELLVHTESHLLEVP